MTNQHKIPNEIFFNVICFIVQAFNPRELMSIRHFNALKHKFINLRGIGRYLK